ncbi:hypothetical protein RB597_009723 [Gaeumannomyces tritici]
MRRLPRTLPRLPCRGRAPAPSPLVRRPFHTSPVVRQQSETGADADTGAPFRPTSAPKRVIDIKHIRQNPTLYEQNCIERNYKDYSDIPARINLLHEQWQAKQREGRSLRERSNQLRGELATPPSSWSKAEAEVFTAERRESIIKEARELKEELSVIEDAEASLTEEMSRLAEVLPNLTSASTPRGEEPLVLSYINDDPEQESGRPSETDRVWRSHVHIGSELGLLDFAGAASSSGWGWYYLLNEGAELEQALVQYTLAVATRHGWGQVSPPSIVYSHIANACGFQPRDQNGEMQIYELARSTADTARGKPSLSLTGTAEIPLAAMKADSQLEESELPLRRVAASRCYRAEAGARGADTKGLYRVHEFTKVEMFAWSAPSEAAAEDVFEEMLDIQTEILGSLGLRCRVLEMPTADLGASAARKVDIEAFFPSRRQKNDGWGEVTSASVCTDYQTRRLATRVRFDGKMTFPWTLNGTALAVPRVLAAILENGWDEDSMTAHIPEVLRPWMNGKDKIVGSRRRK